MSSTSWRLKLSVTESNVQHLFRPVVICTHVSTSQSSKLEGTNWFLQDTERRQCGWSVCVSYLTMSCGSSKDQLNSFSPAQKTLNKTSALKTSARHSHWRLLFWIGRHHVHFSAKKNSQSKYVRYSVPLESSSNTVYFHSCDSGCRETAESC